MCFLYFVLLICVLNSSLAVRTFDAIGRLNLSSSCPDAYCHLDLISENDQTSGYGNSQALHLRQLHLYNCNRYSMPLTLLHLTPNLQSLVMQNCSMYSIGKESLKPARNLSSLQIQGTHLWLLRDRQFDTAPKLEMLELGHNSIHTVHDKAFMGLDKLRLLGLQSNGIGQLMANTFDPLVQLLHLDLSDNEVEHLPVDIFAKNVHLQTLLLNGNPLGLIQPQTLLGLSKLRLLDLSHCARLEELHLNSVQTVHLEDSGLQSLIIEGGVISLQAGNNELTLLSIGDKSSVMELDLHGNLLDANETDLILQGMWNLQRLDLSKNILETWPLPQSSPSSSDIFLLPSLTHLNLASNRLMDLPKESPLLSSRLTHLNLSLNSLRTLPAQNLSRLQNLEHLYLEGNMLFEIDYVLIHRQHEHLRELSLFDNEWSLSFLHKMVTYLGDRGVSSPVKVQHKQQANKNEALMPEIEVQAQAQAQLGVAGIHPYWTTRDVLAFITLLVVLAILLIQLWYILKEEGCLRRLRQWCGNRQSNIRHGSNGTHRLNEQDSEV